MFLSDFSIKRPVAMIVIIIALMGAGPAGTVQAARQPDPRRRAAGAGGDASRTRARRPRRWSARSSTASRRRCRAISRRRQDALHGQARAARRSCMIFNFDKNMVEAADEVRNAIGSGAPQAADRDARAGADSAWTRSAQPIMHAGAVDAPRKAMPRSRAWPRTICPTASARFQAWSIVNVNGSLRRELSVLLRAEKLREFYDLGDRGRECAARAEHHRAGGQGARHARGPEHPAGRPHRVAERVPGRSWCAGASGHRAPGPAGDDRKTALPSSGRLRRCATASPTSRMSITRSRDASTVSVANQVRKLVAEINKTLPEGTTLDGHAATAARRRRTASTTWCTR